MCRTSTSVEQVNSDGDRQCRGFDYTCSAVEDIESLPCAGKPLFVVTGMALVCKSETMIITNRRNNWQDNDEYFVYKGNNKLVFVHVLVLVTQLNHNCFDNYEPRKRFFIGHNTDVKYTGIVFICVLLSINHVH